MIDRKNAREPYVKPKLVKHVTFRDITSECPDWQCSVVVPSPPQA
ncbi:MAG: hypothetical protein WC828_06915 [Thermoleophilia bacterium]